jgi:16S rRNA G966 N2-methylase RsmD
MASGTLNSKILNLLKDKEVIKILKENKMELEDKIKEAFSDERMVTELMDLLARSRKGSDAHRENIKFVLALLNKLPDTMVNKKLKSVNNIELTPHNIRETIYNHTIECSNHNPGIIKWFINHFKSKRILDMSSGWGDRLLGAMSCNIDLYYGVDPNSCLHPNYKKMIEFFKPQLVNLKVQIEIYELPFEKAKLQDNFYDLMFTSPPYFDIEIYDSNSETQSTHNKNESEWYNNYLKVWINLIYKALKNGGIMAFNINQFRHHNFVQWLINDLRKDNKWKFLGTIGYTGKVIKNVQPIFLWKKL